MKSRKHQQGIGLPKRIKNNKIPRADPSSPETRLLRAIFGLCPYCNLTKPHEHPCIKCGKEQPLSDGSYCYHY